MSGLFSDGVDEGLLGSVEFLDDEEEDGGGDGRREGDSEDGYHGMSSTL